VFYTLCALAGSNCSAMSDGSRPGSRLGAVDPLTNAGLKRLLLVDLKLI
jgi:hypothetical protein